MASPLSRAPRTVSTTGTGGVRWSMPARARMPTMSVGSPMPRRTRARGVSG